MMRYSEFRHKVSFPKSSALVWGSMCLLALSGILVAISSPSTPEIQGRLVAVGIPGVSAVSAVGTFHEGGPIHDKPAFRAFTEPGKILDPERILVTSTSNFGAPTGHSNVPASAVLSIDPRGGTAIQVPPTFATSGDQATALDGHVMLFTANSPGFMNRIYNPAATTADLPPVSNSTAISINNAFGRIWITGEPFGVKGAGIHTVLDPDGRPLNGAPSKTAGGVFSGNLTNRTPQLVEGSMATGTLATALLGKSPDGSGRAVFAGLQADGSVVQVHVEKGVDGLASAGTIKPLSGKAHASRAGMVFNWVPNPLLYLADPVANSIVVLSLRTDGKIFHVEESHRISVRELNVPIDLAPAVAEVANPAFSSNTTLAGDADIYVANRGNGTIVRLKQNGSVVAIRKVTLPGVGPVGADRLNGIAISPDAQHLWVTVTGSLPGHPEGAVAELPVFGGTEGGQHTK
jgi:hypothetical protein